MECSFINYFQLPLLMSFSFEQVKALLEDRYQRYNTPAFIPHDPVSVPHLFQQKQDIEIAGFFAAILAWGQRKTIINKCHELLQRLDNAPYQFITQHHDEDLKQLLGFKHRTFNDTDLLYLVYFSSGSMNSMTAWKKPFLETQLRQSLARKRGWSISTTLYSRCLKLLTAPANTFLHLLKNLPASVLICICVGW